MALDTFPVDTATPVGIVRTLINDMEQWPYDGPDKENRYRLTDAQLQAYIALNKDGLYGAGADALRALAANEVLIGKVIRTEDLQVNGAQVSAELRLLAKELGDRQKADDAETAWEDAFEIVPSEYPYYSWES